MKVEPVPDSPPLREVPCFDLSKHAEGVSAKDSDTLALTPLPAKAVLPSRGDFDHESAASTYAEKYVDTFLGQPMEKSEKRDSITEFYSALKNRKAVLQYALTDDQKHNTPEKF